MKKRSYICSVILLLASLSLLIACQPDADESDDLLAETSVSIVVNTRATGETDGTVRCLRLVVTGWTDKGTGTVSYNRLNESPEITTGFTVKARKGDNNFYLIANETPDMTSALDALKTAADVDQFKIKFKPLKAGESPVMFDVMKKVAVNAADKDKVATVTYTDAVGITHTGQDKLPLTLTRTSARFSLAFIKRSDAFTVKNLSFKVLRIPSYSCLGENQTYPGTQWSTEALPQSSTAELTVNNTATWNASTGEYTYGKGDKISFDDFYLPEHLPEDAHRGVVDYSTVLLVNGTCILPGGREQDANWQVNLMANKNFNINRNNYYKVAVSIIGMGAIGMAAEVMPVTEHDIPVNWGVSDGLIVVSDRTADYGKNLSVANDMTAYSGILKVVKTTNGTATYHDALFKFGSVIGISAPITAGTAYNSITDVLYDPALVGNAYVLTPWASVPAAASTAIISGNTYDALKQGLGDPCQLIGVTSRQMEQGRYSNGLWHTATPEELQRLIDNGDAKAGITADSRGLLGFHELLVPTSARRDANGSTVVAGGQGFYWSGNTAQRLVFTASSANAVLNNSGSPQEAYPLRCVRNTIPESEITVANITVGYQGGTFTIPVNTNVPHWTAEMITSANINGDVANAGDPAGVTLQTTSGGYAGTISVSVPRRTQSDIDRVCYIRIIGTGYDGVLAKRIITLLQNRLEWRVTIVSNTMDQAGNQLPGAGGNYTAVLSVTPVDATVFPKDVTCQLTISASGVADVVGQKITMTSQTVNILYTIPQNTSPGVRMVTLKFEVSGTGISNRTEQSKIQAK